MNGARNCRQAGTAERQGAQETQEVQQFLEAVVQTPCMQFAHKSLVDQVCFCPSWLYQLGMLAQVQTCSKAAM